MRKILLLIALIFSQAAAIAQTNVTIQVDASVGRKPISPYIYGRNNDISDDPTNPTTATQWQLYRDAGLHFTRENGGNNATKYNWRLKLSSHPDWYNNAYAHDWDYAAKTLEDSMPGAQGMWAFQLIGEVASNTSNNFNDWGYNQSQYWSGVCQNLAGGGTVNTAGGCTALVNGDTSLYLMNWPADSSIAILNHWFGTGGLGYNENNILYWNMDNEPEIWSSTHDDVMPTQLPAESFMQRYFTVAKAARALFPGVKLSGPIAATEWQWYTWNNAKITDGSNSYTWIEYFIKRCAEEQTASGIRLLDVIDLHDYPGETQDSDIVQHSRIFFDTTYNYPGANGVKETSPSGWDNSITKEYIFKRCSDWLTQYMGANNGVTFGISEYGANNNGANVSAINYASILGTFADNGVTYFAPWYWYPGMWEEMHLFSRYGKSTCVESISDNEHDVSAYSSINTTGDSMTVILVNRALTESRNTTVNISNFTVTNGNYQTLQLSQLPSTETFVSQTNNALKAGIVSVSGNAFTLTLPALSTTALTLYSQVATDIKNVVNNTFNASLRFNPVTDYAVIDLNANTIQNFKVELVNTLGQVVYTNEYSGVSSASIVIPCNNLSQGIYVINLLSSDGEKRWTTRLVKN